MSRRALTAGCGNGVVESEIAEACDDGNTADSDGCSATCTVETGFTCFGSRPSVCTGQDRSDGPASYGLAQHSRSLPSVSPFVGRDFWTAFSRNAATPTALAIKVAGASGTNGEIRNTAGTLLSAFTLPVSGIATATLTVATFHVSTFGVVTNQGVHITADADVRVLGSNEYLASTDTWGVWSNDKIGTDYLIPDIPGTNLETNAAFAQQILFVGVQANTAVVLRNAAGVSVASFTLNAGQVYQYQAAADTTTAGFSVTSDKPVNVIPGSQCDNIGGACDITVEQLAPTRYWANSYVAGPPFFASTVKVRHSVLASQNGTTITITASDGTVQNTTLDAGQRFIFADVASDGTLGYFVNADKPIMVASLVADPAPGRTYDASLVYWPPVDGYVTSAQMPTSGVTLTFANFLTLMTRTSATANVLVNGAAVGGWVAIAATGYSFSRVAVPAGDNTITGTNGVTFGAMANGGAQAVGYAYSSPYDIAGVGGTTTSYLGTLPPDYELSLTGNAAANADDTLATDDEDALTAPTSVPLNASNVSMTFVCNDNYFGTQLGSTIYGFLDFDRDGAFGAGESASTGCSDTSSTANGTATLTWTNPVYSTTGTTVIRLRICDVMTDCSTPIGSAPTGEVEDHAVHIGICGDAFLDTFEACDDGDLDDLDGCSSTCTVEAGFICSGSPSVCLLSTAPAITSPASGTLTTDNTPTFSGTCTAGATVSVFENATLLCTASCTGGVFSCMSSMLSEGSHGITANQLVAAFTSVMSATLTLNVDASPPASPTITAPIDGAVFNMTTPVVTGTCEAGATVRVRNGATVVCTIACASDGTYSCNTSSLAQGSATLAVDQTDVGSNLSVPSGSVIITVDTVAAAPTIATPAAAELVSATPDVAGACETGANVSVFEGSTVLCSAACFFAAYSCTSSVLSTGAHSITVRQLDAAGNNSPFSSARSFSVAGTPQPPVLASPLDGDLFADSTPTISGSCTSGATVSAFENASMLCSAVCSASTFSCDASSLSDGSHTITARQTRFALTSSDSAARSFTIDSAAPSAPVISAPLDGSLTRDTTLTIVGSCETGASLSVLDGITVLCVATCSGGSFECTSGALAEGSHSITATQRDLAGNTSPASTAHSATVDSAAPSAPLVTLPLTGTLTANTMPSVAGSCETGASVSVYEGSTLLCSTTCVAGMFACNTSGLTDASHSVVVRQIDAAGNESVSSVSIAFSVDATAPLAPALTQPSDGALTNSDSPAFGGSCESGATVEVLEGATVLCSAPCVAEAFACSASGLADADHSVTARQSDSAGNTSQVGTARSVTVDTTSPLPPIILAPVADALSSSRTPDVTGSCETGATVSVLSGATVLCSALCTAATFSCSVSSLSDGTYTISATQTDSAGNTGLASVALSVAIDGTSPLVPLVTAPAAGALSGDDTPAISGSCESFATVSVFEGATLLCSSVCSAGAFVCDTSLLSDGIHVIFVQQVDRAGNTSTAGTTQSLGIDTTAAAAPAITSPADEALINDDTPTITGSCESAAMVELVEDASVLCTATCVAEAFSCDASSLSDGDHDIFARQTDPAGNVSVGSATRNLMVDTTVPAAPSLSAPAEDALINSHTPGMFGNCETGATVTVADGATVLCSAPCSAGAFTCTSSLLVGERGYSIVVRQTDQAGNVSGDSLPRVFTIDSTAPASPVVALPVAGLITNDNTQTFSGTCSEPSTIVTVVEGVQSLCSTTCSTGHFSCTSNVLVEGVHSFAVRQIDGAGNASLDSVTRSFTVDTLAPAAPAALAPTDNTLTNDNTLSISGTCESGAGVAALDATDRMLCTAVCSSGAFSCETVALEDGPHVITLRQSDAAGNVGSLSAGLTVVIDTTAPAMPVVSGPSAGVFSHDSVLPVSGTCANAATVTVLDGATVLCSTSCVAGTFSCNTSVLIDGEHAITVRQTDAAGNTSTLSDARDVTIDTIEPAAPHMSAPADATLWNHSPVVAGSCEAGATITVVEGNTTLCSVTCALEVFSCLLPMLSDGMHSITSWQTDVAGNTSSVGAVITLSIDMTAPAAPLLDQPAAGPLAGKSLTGSCESGATVSVLEGDSVLCSAPCLINRFSCDAGMLTEGVHRLSAQQTDVAGNASAASAMLSFDATAATAAPTIANPIEGAIVTDLPVIDGTCASGSVVSLWENNVSLCELTCVDGVFSCELDLLSAGSHSVVARQLTAGNASSRSAARTFSVVPVASPTTPSTSGHGCNCTFAGTRPGENSGKWALTGLLLGFASIRRRRR